MYRFPEPPNHNVLSGEHCARVRDRLMRVTDSCTAVIINYQTPDLTMRAIRSLRQWYKELPLLLIDNGSRDTSRAVLERYSLEEPECTKVMFHSSNLYHGPSMDKALRSLESPYVFILDSDCEIQRGGFLEQMIERLENTPQAYAVGKMTFMDRRGYDVPRGKGGIPYIRPICMIIRRDYYLTLPPFRHHGAPCLDNMEEAGKRKWELIDFPIDDYVSHQGRGTAGRFGYGLGWRGKINHLFHKLGF